MRAYDLKKALAHPDEVRELFLHGLAMDRFPEEILRCTNLRVLDLSRNRFREIPESLGALSDLVQLVLDHNQLEDLPAAIASLPQLSIVSVRHNQLQGIPPSLLGCQQLRRLDLSHNKLSKLPNPGLSWPLLQWLSLSHNRIKRLPAGFEQLDSLRELCLDSNRLQQLPANIGEMRVLEKLDLQYNKLSDLPASIGDLSCLLALNLGGNRLAQLPASLSRCSALRQIDLSENQLSALPDCLNELPWLDTLNVSANQLTVVSITSGRLRTLNLSVNPLGEVKALPQGLRTLSLARTPIRALPPTVTQLGELQSLNLAKTGIASFPVDIVRLSKLEELNLTGLETRQDSVIELLLSMPALQKLKGGVQGIAPAQLTGLLEHCRKASIPPQYRLLLWRMLQREAVADTALPRKTWLQALSIPIPHLKQRIAQLLIHDKEPIAGGAVISLLGRTVMSPTVWKEKLDQTGIRIAAAGETPTHLVLGRPPFDLNMVGEQPLIDESMLMEWLYRTTQGQDGPMPDRSHRLQRLLRSRDTAMLRLAGQTLRGIGLPPTLHTDLFLAWKLCENDKLRRELGELLRLHLLLPDQIAMQRKAYLKRGMAAEIMEANIQKLIKDTSLDPTVAAQWLEVLKSEK